MGGIMCLCSLLLLLPHTCLGWILRTYFVRVYLLYLIFFFTTAHEWLTWWNIAQEIDCLWSQLLLSMVTYQALPPLPLNCSCTSEVFNNLCSWELEWCFGIMEAFGLHTGTSGWSLMIQYVQEVTLVMGADALLILNSLKYMKLEVAEQKCTLYMSQDQAPCYFPTWKVDSRLVNSEVWEYLLKHCTHLQAIWEVPWVSEYCSLKSNVSVMWLLSTFEKNVAFVKSLHSSNSLLFLYIYSPGSITFCFDSCQKLNERYLGKGGFSYRRNSCGFLFVTHMLSVTFFFFFPFPNLCTLYLCLL